MPEDFENLLDETVEVDPEADFYAMPPPVPDGLHQYRVKLGDRGISARRQKKQGETKDTASGPPYLNVHIELRAIDDGTITGSNPVVFDNATSIIMGSSGTSALHGFLRELGVAVPRSSPLRDLKKLVEDTLAQEPQVGAVTQWEAQVQTSPGVYETIRKGMKNFPPDGKGGFSPRFTDPKYGECEARAQVRRYQRTKGAAAPQAGAKAASTAGDDVPF